MEQYKKFQCVHILRTEFITSMALSPDGTIFACGETDNYTCKDQSISVFDLNTGQRICTFNIFGRAVFADFIAISPNGKHLVWNTSGQIRVGDLTTGQEICRILSEDKGFNKELSSIIISPDGERIIGFSSKTTKAFDLKTGKEIYSFQAPSDLIKFIGISPDGETIIGNLGNVITLWNLKTGQEISSLSVKLINLRTKSELRTFKALSNPIKFVAMNSHSQTLVTVNCNDTITLWDLKAGKEIRTIEWRSYKGRSLVVSFDCQIFIDFNYTKVGKSEGVTIWDLYRGEKIKTIASDAVQDQSLVFSANQHTIVYASGYWGVGELVKVWRLL